VGSGRPLAPAGLASKPEGQLAMEVHVDAPDEALVKEDLLLSVRFGGVRRQVALGKAAQAPLVFPEKLGPKDAKNLRFDLLAKVGTGWLLLRPGEERYKISFNGSQDARSLSVRVTSGQEAAGKDAHGVAAQAGAEPPSGGGSGTPSTRPCTADDSSPKGHTRAPGLPEGCVEDAVGEEQAAKGCGKEAPSRQAKYRDRAQSAKDYLEDHQVVTFIQALLHAVLKERPPDPYAFMATQMPRPEPAPVPKTPLIAENSQEVQQAAAASSSGEGEMLDLRLSCARLRSEVQDLQRENDELLEKLGLPRMVRANTTAPLCGAGTRVPSRSPSREPRRNSVGACVRRPAITKIQELQRTMASPRTPCGLLKRPTLLSEDNVFSRQTTLFSRQPSTDPAEEEVMAGANPSELEDSVPPWPVITRSQSEMIRPLTRRGEMYTARRLDKFWKRLRGENDASDEYRVLRQSVFTGRWTLYTAGGQVKKPLQYTSGTRRTPHLLEVPRCEPRCPFCVGNEHKTPHPLLFFDSSGEMHEDRELPEGWLCRVIPNIFPLLVTPKGSGGLYGERFYERLAEIPHSAAARGEHANEALFPKQQDPLDKDDIEASIHRQVNAVGYSEVVIENPAHNGLLAIVDSKQVALALRALQARGRVLCKQPRVRQLLYFKQYGALSGGSLVHPHMQIVTLPLLTPETQNRLHRAVDFHRRFGKCAVCQSLVEEPLSEDGHARSRLVHESRHFLVVVPFASNQYRVTIAPKKHCHSWLGISREEVEDLAEVLQLVMEALFHALNDPEYNVYFFSIDKPTEVADRADEAVHWVLEVHPRFPAELGGVELASGIRVISGLPEDWAKQFRAAIDERQQARLRQRSKASFARPSSAYGAASPEPGDPGAPATRACSDSAGAGGER